MDAFFSGMRSKVQLEAQATGQQIRRGRKPSGAMSVAEGFRFEARTPETQLLVDNRGVLVPGLNPYFGNTTGADRFGNLHLHTDGRIRRQQLNRDSWVRRNFRSPCFRSVCGPFYLGFFFHAHGIFYFSVSRHGYLFFIVLFAYIPPDALLGFSGNLTIFFFFLHVDYSYFSTV